MAEVSLILNKIKSSNVDFEEARFVQLCEDTSPETVFKILAHFHETLKASAKSIENAIPQSDLETIGKAAHKISGSAELLGFVNYGNNAKNLNHTIKTNHNFSSENDQVMKFLKETQQLQENILSALPNLSQLLS